MDNERSYRQYEAPTDYAIPTDKTISSSPEKRIVSKKDMIFGRVNAVYDGVRGLIRNGTSMEYVLTRLKLWALLVLPITGYTFGWLIQLAFQTFLQSGKEYYRLSGLVIHFLTMIFVISIFNDVVFNPERMKDVRDKALFLCISYLFLLGAVFGIVS